MRQRTSSVNGLLIFLVYGMFALFSLFLVVIGAQVYRGVVSTGDSNAAMRTGFSYIANKLRMSTESGGVSLAEEDGVQVLTIKNNVAGGEYETRIYYADGALWEQFSLAGADFDPAAGEKISDAAAFSMEESRPGELCLSMTAPDGTEQSMCLRCLSEEGGQ